MSGFTKVSFVKDNLQNTFSTCFGDFDSFWFLPDAGEQEVIDRCFQPTRLLVEPDVPIDTHQFPTDHRLKSTLQAFLQQIHGWKRSNELREEYERLAGVHYDFVVRCRPDVIFSAPIPQLDQFDPGEITVPAFHRWQGYNDRFAVGNRKNMSTLMNFFDFVIENPSSLYQRNSERVFKEYLDSRKIRIRQHRGIRFHRVRYISGKYVVKRDGRKVAARARRRSI